MGAALRAGIGRLCGGSTEDCVILANLGMLEGAAPDVADWIAWKFFGAERWRLYSRLHTGDLVWIGWIFWGAGLHMLTDRPFHKNPGEDWWPRLWWMEVGYFVASVATLWFVFAS